MKINRIDHVCIAVKNLDKACSLWEPVIGKKTPDDTYIDELEQIRVARYWIGEVGFELMESTSQQGDVNKWIKKHGEGIMLLSFNVDNTKLSVKNLEKKKYSFIPDKNGKIIRPFRDCKFAFIHPKNLNGVLTEIIDYKWEKKQTNSL